ncbi:MAG: acyltransferase [Propioniciclava sp.]|uniref:acyltransferase family protein n=1 Tax=Propioniciclava sp. TaxID=2038686 RepID=UPI0039E2828D
MPDRRRNHVIDLARACSVLVVVVYHTLVYRVKLIDGRPVLEAWAAPSWLYPLTWLLMIMPLFFVAGGFAHTLTLDRLRAAGGASVGHWLAGRGRRLVGPLMVFVTFCAVLFSAVTWAGWPDAAEVSRLLMQLLWFITVYLVIVAIAPGMVRLHDRFGVAPMAVLAIAAAGVDAWSFAAGDYTVRNLNMILVWPLVHQFGIAYQRGWWRRGPVAAAWASVTVGVTGVLVLVFGFGYPATAVGFADLPIANLQPPTVAMAFLALAQCGMLGLVERAGVLDSLSPAVQQAVGILNTVAMSVYLWHIPCLVASGTVLLLLSLIVPALAGALLSPVTLALATVATVFAVIPLLGRLELWAIPPMGETQHSVLAIVTYVLLAGGTFLVWQTGTVVDLAHPWSSIGVLAIWAGWWTMRRAANRTAAGAAR